MLYRSKAMAARREHMDSRPIVSASIVILALASATVAVHAQEAPIAAAAELGGQSLVSTWLPDGAE